MRQIFGWILDIIVTALALFVVTWLIPGIDVIAAGEGEYSRAWTFLGVAAIFLIINAVIGPVVRTLGLPLTCLTFGLFALVINAGIFALTGWLSTQLGLGLSISSFGAALLGAIVLALVRSLLSTLTAPAR